MIALIITIIVLLILAGVTISTFTGDGSIIDNAKNAVEKYNNSVANEQEMLNEIKDYIKNDGNIEESNGITISVTPNTTGIAKKVTLTVAVISESGIKSITSNAGVNKTYAEGTKEILETCEITENGIYTFTVENEKGQTASKGILIGNILEGTIVLTPDKTMATKDNVKVTISWPEGSEEGIKEIKVGTGSWQSASGSTSEVEVTENCTVQARVRNGEEEVIQASITISNIDKANPIVTATSGTETIEEGTSKDISSYFTYSENGTAEITSVVYTDTSNGNVVVTNTNTLALGTHIIKCTVTKETGATASATKTIVVEKGALVPASEYGAYVTNYTTPNGDPNVGWRIFYADESNIYLIADDYIHFDYAPESARYTLYDNGNGYKLSFDDVYNDYTGSANITDPRITKWLQKYLAVAPESTNDNIRAVAFMLDETKWSAKYANSSYAEYAIGGPTLELFVASYNKTHQEKPMYCSADSTGYYISWNEGGTNTSISGLNTEESLYVIKSTSKTHSMWLGSPSALNATRLTRVLYDGGMDYTHWDTNNGSGFRPLVCLRSGIQLEKQSDGTYLIK